jgi:hypothetical protein
MLNVPIFANTADICAIVQIVPHTCQRMMDEQRHRSVHTAAKILEISGEWGHKDYDKDVRVMSIETCHKGG